MRIFVFLLTVLVGSACSLGQRTQQDYEAELLHKPLFLRGLWEKNELHFNGGGTLAGKSGVTGPLMSSIQISAVELKADQLVLTGRRLAIIYDGPPKLLDLNQPIHVFISQPPAGDYDPAIGAILTTRMSDLAAASPECLQGVIAPRDPWRPAPPRDPSLRRIGGAVSAPIVKVAPNPQYPLLARQFAFSGNVLVALQVDTLGMPTHIRVLRPRGLGLDESAVAAVAQYRFTPALEHGHAVPVEMAIEVNF